MHSIVCVKEVPDPLGIAQLAEGGRLRLDQERKRIAAGQGVAMVMSPFDEQAVEAALRIKDTHGGTVTILCQGQRSSVTVVKHGLAMGADCGIVLCDPAFEGADAYATARTLAAVIRKLGAFDLVLCGRQAADTDEGLVGASLAEALGVPCVTLAGDIAVAEGAMVVTRALPDGSELVQAPLPAVVTVSNELGTPRYPSLAGLMAAARKRISFWGLAELGLDASQVGLAGSRMRVLELTVPAPDSRCEFITGSSPGEAARNLALKLREHGLI